MQEQGKRRPSINRKREEVVYQLKKFPLLDIHWSKFVSIRDNSYSRACSHSFLDQLHYNLDFFF
jgi:hypothetical protein